MAHPYSVPGPIEKVPGSLWLLASEGGALAFLNGHVQAAFEDPDPANVKRVPISSHGVVPVEMRVDPDATLNDSTLDANDLVYVAGGRDGLWVMQAHPSPAIALDAARVDDSHVSGQDQDSARWCSAVDVIEIGQTRYLAALFSARGDNRLRLYPLNAVRAVLPGPELGSELTATVEVLLDQHPDWQPAPGTNGFAEAFGYGMDVLGTHVYVTLGTHGLVRVEFDPQDLQNPVVQGGPVFGDGSYYATQDVLFGDLVYWHTPNSSQPSKVERRHPPFFVDVVAYTYESDDFVVVSVDHLGWMRFDVTSAFHYQLDIEHHEGEVYTLLEHFDGSDWNELEAVSLVVDEVEDDDHARTYARRMDLVPTPLGPALAVAAHPHPLWMFPGHHNEGRQVGPVLDQYGGVDSSVAKQIQGFYRWTLVYDLHPSGGLQALQRNSLAEIRAGGGQVKLVVPVLTGGVEEPPGGLMGGMGQLYLPLMVFTGLVADSVGGKKLPPDPPPPQDPTPKFLDSAQATLRVQVTWDDVQPGAFDEVNDVWHRTNQGRPGRMIRDIAPSLGAPEVLWSGNNDSGFLPDGLLAVCTNTVQTFLPSVPGGTKGIVFEADAQWVPSINMGGHIVWGHSSWHQATVVDNGDPCAQPPVPPSVVKVVEFKPLSDRFVLEPRILFSGAGAIDLAYDAHVGAQPVIFITALSTADGVTAIRRKGLDSEIDGAMSTDPIALAGLPPPRIDIGKLDTHPEYQNVPPALGRLGNNGLSIAPLLQTYFPKLVQLEGPESEPGVRDRWALVVPSGSVQFPWNHPFLEDHELIEKNPTWLPPSVFLTHNDRLMLRIFDVTDPGELINTSNQDFPNPAVKSYTILGRNERSHAVRLRVEDFEDRTWCFVADLGGSITVYDLTDILLSTPGTIFQDVEHAVWYAPESISDNLPRNIPNVLVDVVEGRLIVYASVWRHGLAVLEFFPDETLEEDRLVHLKTIQTPGRPAGLAFREVSGERQLIVGDETGGFRILRQPAPQ